MNEITALKWLKHLNRSTVAVELKKRKITRTIRKIHGIIIPIILYFFYYSNTSDERNKPVLQNIIPVLYRFNNLIKNKREAREKWELDAQLSISLMTTNDVDDDDCAWF